VIVGTHPYGEIMIYFRLEEQGENDLLRLRKKYFDIQFMGKGYTYFYNRHIRADYLESVGTSTSPNLWASKAWFRTLLLYLFYSI
jgi:hypothetical protein